MALGLRLVSICVVAGFYGAATAHGETVDLLRPTIAEDEAFRRKNRQSSLHSR